MPRHTVKSKKPKKGLHPPLTISLLHRRQLVLFTDFDYAANYTTRSSLPVLAEDSALMEVYADDRQTATSSFHYTYTNRMPSRGNV